MRPLIKLTGELRLIAAPVWAACLVYVVATATVFATFRDATTRIGSLAPNMFAGSIDALFTVILINYVIARTSRRDYRPMRLAAFLEAAEAIQLLQVTWFAMIKASSLTLPPEGADLLDAEYFDTVAEHLDLDRPGLGTSTWLTRAAASGTLVKHTVGRITSDYAPALSPDSILRCTEFKYSALVQGLASLVTFNARFAARGTTMQKPFVLSHAKESADKVRRFVAMVREMAKEFEGEAVHKSPASFIVTADMARGRNSAADLSSARIE